MFQSKCLVISLFCFINPLHANMAPEGFGKFTNYYFVETGTFNGDGVMMALKAKFSEIHSIEIDPVRTKKAKSLFEKLKQVHIWCGDSGVILKDVIKNMNKPITFWLDGHRYPPKENDGKKNTALLAELDQIKQHPIKTHTIIIDDMHYCGTEYFDFATKEQIVKKVLEINPNYTITYIDGGVAEVQKKGILVASITK